MKRVLRHLVPMAALWLAATASAQQIKPGLWENTSQMGGAMGAPMAQMQQQMASMPPAQRKQMEAMLAHPVLINRPIVVTPLGVKLCRPSESVLDLLPPR